MNNHVVKYPKTSHLPWSQGASRDDKILKSIDQFFGKMIVCTEKIDGENSSIYYDGYSHARSLDSNNHPSRNWLKKFWSERYFKLPHGWRICGENVYARHIIGYDELQSYFMGFSLWDGDECKSWDETLEWFDELGIIPVPVLYRGIFDEKILKSLVDTMDLEKQEGYVIRVADSFTVDFSDSKHDDEQFSQYIAKFVRKGHVNDDTEHWMNKEIIKNGLKHD